jgi:hypothetical protein
VIVQNDVQADAARVVDDARHCVARALAGARPTAGQVVARGNRIGGPHLIRERQADGVGARRVDAIDNRHEVLFAESVRHADPRLEAVPVDAGHRERLSVRPEHVGAADTPPARSRSPGRQGHEGAQKAAHQRNAGNPPHHQVPQ